MEKINVTELFRHRTDTNCFESWLDRCLLHLLTQKSFKDFGITPRTTYSPPLLINVELKIEGVEVSFESLIKELYTRFEHAVKERVEEYIPDKADECLVNFEDAVRDMQDQLEKMVQEAGKKLYKGDTVLGEGKFLRLVSQNGWEYAERTSAHGVVLVLAVTDDDEIILVEQFRAPVRSPCIELPAGLCDIENESAADTARRELEEETGYRAREMKHLTQGPTSPGMTTETTTMFAAVGLEKVGDGGGIEGENITIHKIPLSEVLEWLKKREKDGVMVDTKVYAGIFFANMNLD